MNLSTKTFNLRLNNGVNGFEYDSIYNVSDIRSCLSEDGNIAVLSFDTFNPDTNKNSFDIYIFKRENAYIGERLEYHLPRRRKDLKVTLKMSRNGRRLFILTTYIGDDKTYIRKFKDELCIYDLRLNKCIFRQPLEIYQDSFIRNRIDCNYAGDILAVNVIDRLGNDAVYVYNCVGYNYKIISRIGIDRKSLYVSSRPYMKVTAIGDKIILIGKFIERNVDGDIYSDITDKLIYSRTAENRFIIDKNTDYNSTIFKCCYETLHSESHTMQINTDVNTDKEFIDFNQKFALMRSEEKLLFLILRLRIDFL